MQLLVSNLEGPVVTIGSQAFSFGTRGVDDLACANVASDDEEAEVLLLYTKSIMYNA